MTAPAAKSGTNVTQAVPMFWVRDVAASTRFYMEGLGFTMKHRWEPEGKLRWCWLEIGGAALMLQVFWTDGINRNATVETLGVGVSINFICEDALAIYREVTARGVRAKRPFVGNAMWVTEVVDPDGYRLFFESPTDAPEESVLSEDG